MVLNLGLESYRNRFGEAIVKAVLLFILRCRLHVDVRLMLALARAPASAAGAD